MRYILALLLWFNFYSITQAGWTNSTVELNNKLVSIGFKENISRLMIDECKSTARDPYHCVVIASMIYYNESSSGTRCYKFSCWGMTRSYTSDKSAFLDWIKTYNKHWYKGLKPKDFYGKNNRTHYCTSEVSSHTIGYCPNGLKNSTIIYNKLYDKGNTPTSIVKGRGKTSNKGGDRKSMNNQIYKGIKIYGNSNSEIYTSPRYLQIYKETTKEIQDRSKVGNIGDSTGKINDGKGKAKQSTGQGLLERGVISNKFRREAFDPFFSLYNK